MAKEPITFILIDESVLTNGFRVLVDGVDLSQMKRNPVMLGLHKDSWLPIGRWINFRKKDGQILADAEFDYDDPDEDVQRLIGKVERGFVKMASAGLVDLLFSDDPKLKMKNQRYETIIQSRMREASIVPIGANHNALRLFNEAGEEINLENEAEVLQLMDTHKTEIQTKINKMLKVTKLLNLADDANEDAIEQAVQLLLSDNTRLKNENETLTTRVDTLNKEQLQKRKGAFVELLDAAVKEGRLNADGKDSMLELFDLDPTKAEKAVNAIPSRQSVTARINAGNEENSVELADLKKKSWDELDQGGDLTLLHDKYPDVYAQKFESKFGVKPQM